MELGKLNRKLVVGVFLSGAMLRLLVFVYWPWCLTMAAVTGDWLPYTFFFGAIPTGAVLGLREVVRSWFR